MKIQKSCPLEIVRNDAYLVREAHRLAGVVGMTLKFLYEQRKLNEGEENVLVRVGSKAIDEYPLSKRRIRTCEQAMFKRHVLEEMTRLANIVATMADHRHVSPSNPRT